MAKNADASAIQFRRLNTRKGLAVQGSRSQNDRDLYRRRMKSVLEAQPNLDIRQAMVERLLVRDGKVQGVETRIHERFAGRAVILTTGTFLKGLIHVGLDHFPGGRMGDPPAGGLSASTAGTGLRAGPPEDRHHAPAQRPDHRLRRPDRRCRGMKTRGPFSFTTERLPLPQRPVPHHLHQRADPCDHPGGPRALAAVQRGHRGSRRPLLPLGRRQGGPVSGKDPPPGVPGTGRSGDL